MAISINVSTITNITGAWIQGPALPGSPGAVIQDISPLFSNFAIAAQNVSYVWRIRRYAQGSILSAIFLCHSYTHFYMYWWVLKYDVTIIKTSYGSVIFAFVSAFFFSFFN